MKKIFSFSIKITLVLFFVAFNLNKSYGVEETVLQQLEDLQNDIKTLEKAVYSQDLSTTNSNNEILKDSGDVLTKHLLK